MRFAIGLVLFGLALAYLAPWARAGVPCERPISFAGAGGVQLAGTLELPTNHGKSRFPALVLLAGSGPTDRNGNQPPIVKTDLLKQIAVALAGRGIASLRYDKRGMYANASELPKDVRKYGAFFSWENFAGDAAGAYRFLCRQPEIDAGRAGILGHSEGGLLALVAAGTLRMDGAPPKVLILLSTPGRQMDAVIDEQLRGLLRRQGATPAQTTFFLAANHRIDQTILKTGVVPDDVPAGLAALYPAYLGSFLHSELTLDPCDLAARFPGPVLIIAGGADAQVSPQRDAQALSASLARRQHDDHELLIVPGISHNLKTVKGADDPGFAGAVPPQVLHKLAAWAATKLEGGATRRAPG